MKKETFDFTEWEIVETLEKKGVYVLCANKPINKLTRQDACGVLYIGSAGNKAGTLKTRLKTDHHALYYILSILDSAPSFSYEKTDWHCNNCKYTKCNKREKEKECQKITKITIQKEGLLHKANPRVFCVECKNYAALEKKLILGHLLKYGQAPTFNHKNATFNHFMEKTAIRGSGYTAKYFIDAIKQYKNFEKKLSESLKNNKKK